MKKVFFTLVLRLRRFYKNRNKMYLADTAGSNQDWYMVRAVI